MKNDLTCEVVQDLLPSYADGLTSPVTGEAVERHLAACPQCTLALEEMLTPAEITPVKQSEVNYLKRGQRQVVCRCAVLVLTAVYLAALLWLFFLRRNTEVQLGPLLNPLITFRTAWNTTGWAGWRHIALNAVAFTLLGVLLPLNFKKLRRWYLTGLSALGSSFVIGVFRQFLGRGRFDSADLIVHTLAALLGFSLFACADALSQKPRTLTRWGKPLLYPAALGIAVGTLALVYLLQPLGNLASAPAGRFDMDSVELQLGCTLSDGNMSAPIYSADDPETQEGFALSFMERVGADPELTEVMHYDNDSYSNFSSSTWYVERYYESYQQLVCYPISGNFSYECRYQDGSSWYGGWTRGQVEDMLAELGVTPDSLADYSYENGTYTFWWGVDYDGSSDPDAVVTRWLTTAADAAPTQENRAMGFLSCQFDAEGRLLKLDSRSRSLQYSSDAELISPSDAFSQLEQGSFTVLSPLGVEISDDLEAIGLERITIAAVELRYLLDSKGFYQPVYVFSGTWQAPGKSSNPLELMVPALKQEQSALS